MTLRRTHTGSIECSIYEEHPKWIVSIKYPLGSQYPSSTLIARETSLDGAKKITDDAVPKSGHICDSACKGWEQLP
jgi:hypothetical protein